MKKMLILLFSSLVLLSACSETEAEKAIKTEEFSKDGSTSSVAYYKDSVYIDFDTKENGYYSDYTIVFTDQKTQETVYELKGNCLKYYYCNEEISYDKFPKEGVFKAVATLETGATAEFDLTLPVDSFKNETKQ